MTEQNRSSLAVVTFYTTSALVTALGLAILITSATIAYMVANHLNSVPLNSVPFLRCAYRGTNFRSKTRIISGRCSPELPSRV